MDKNAIKKYAVWARRELISRVTQRALKYGISEKEIMSAKETSIHGVALSPAEIAQRTALIGQINNKGFEQVMEEVAYTWFNRFSALRFMEVNGYLPTHVRVFTDDENNFKPQIMAEAINLEMDGLDMEKVYAMKDANNNDALFKYLIITQCNALSSILPGMFQKIDDYTELLFPDNLLRDGSAIEQMISLIPEDDWKDQVQIIGWLYQYYNTEPKDKVFADLKKNIKISKENIPAATQLFTPDWIVRYMVENSLGRLWLEGHPNTAEQLLPTKEEQEKYIAGDRNKDDHKWHYYLEEAEQEPEVQEQLDEIRKEYAALKPEDIKCIDPCSGSGHILAYMFDVLVQIYETYGYTAREAVASIVENNLYGLDIDERAAQLAYFSVMMKARQYDRRFFSRGIQPNVMAIQEIGWIGGVYPDDMGDFLLSKMHQDNLDYLLDVFKDAKEYGSILQLENRDYKALLDAWTLTGSQTAGNINLTLWYATLEKVIPLLCKQAIMLTKKYHVVVTNPPYMGGSGMGVRLSEYVKKNYSDSKSDLFAVFIERCGGMLMKNGYQAMITQHAWMFLSSFEKLRNKILMKDIINMAHLGARAFEEIGGEVVQTTSFVLRNGDTDGFKGAYCRLIEPTSQSGKEEMFLRGENRYTAAQCEFGKIPGSPVAYWVSEAAFNDFDKGTRLAEVCETRKGLATSDNNRFLKLWFEVSYDNISFTCHSNKESERLRIKWYPINKGGEYRRWYGNREYLIDWKNDGYAIRNFRDEKGKLLSRPQNTQYNFKQALTWSKITSSVFSARLCEGGFLFDDAAAICHHGDLLTLKKICGFLNSKCCQAELNILNPTINIQIGDIGNLPILEVSDGVADTVDENISLSRTDWDSFETSWDFQKHPLVRPIQTVADAYTAWQRECNGRFDQLKANEEELNRIFIDIYGLQEELNPEVEEKNVTVRKADLQREIKSLISYAVGCMFGRYSLDESGLIYAGGKFEDKYALYSGTWADVSDYRMDGSYTLGELGSKFYYLKTENKKALECYKVDYDNIIPITDDEYFEDDIVNRFVDFVRIVYGEQTLDENLKFIADALGGKGHSKDVIRNYFLNNFYADHLKIYQKRPIYWLFDSGKKNGFKCLIYMHRYQPDIIARIRTDYVHEQQSRYRTSIADLEKRVASASTGEKVKLTKQLSKLQAQAAELHEYEEKIHHLADQYISIDLDDGVKVNYAKFQDVLAKIK